MRQAKFFELVASPRCEINFEGGRLLLLRVHRYLPTKLVDQTSVVLKGITGCAAAHPARMWSHNSRNSAPGRFGDLAHVRVPGQSGVHRLLDLADLALQFCHDMAERTEMKIERAQD